MFADTIAQIKSAARNVTVGDIIGCVCLFAMFIGLLFLPLIVGGA